jgi:hypothetical protein
MVSGVRLEFLPLCQVVIKQDPKRLKSLILGVFSFRHTKSAIKLFA